MQKIKFFLILLTVLLALSVIALVWISNTFSPDSTIIIVLVYFLIALFGFSISALIGFYIRKAFGQRELLNTYIYTASRQGFWMSLILVISFYLLHLGLFTWINASLLLLTFVFFESFLLMKNRNF